ncbi:MAG TPA: endonuclease domain-containing protein [Actinomycetota bacterium]|nr:endonuclease domain-containing protein [Actinomycetota bacterium]
MELIPPPDYSTKRCPACRRVKALDEFPSNRSRKDGRATYCKPCHNEIMRRNAQRLYGGNANFQRKLRYGIDNAEVAERVRRQGGVCAICGAPDPDHVDHNHATGALRGILCFSCNRGLGKANDDRDVLREAIAYLRRDPPAAPGRLL